MKIKGVIEDLKKEKNFNNSKNISRNFSGAVAGSVGSVQFQIVPCSSCFGSLVQSCCGEGGALQTHTGVCGERSQCLRHTGLAPSHGVCAFPVYAAQAPGCSAGRSKPLRFRFSGAPQRRTLGWASVLCLPRSEQLRRPGVWGAQSPPAQCVLSPPQSQLLGFRARPALCAMYLFRGADLWLRPSWWMSTIQNLKSLVRNRKPVCSLVGDALSGVKFAPSGSGWRPPGPCLGRGMGRSTAGERFSGIGSVLCSVSGPAAP